MFIGAVLGIAAAGLPGLSLAPAIGMGIGAMCSAVVRLPLTSTLLATLLLVTHLLPAARAEDCCRNVLDAAPSPAVLADRARAEAASEPVVTVKA